MSLFSFMLFFCSSFPSALILHAIQTMSTKDTSTSKQTDAHNNPNISSQLRRFFVHQLMRGGLMLSTRQETIALACVFFHRLYNDDKLFYSHKWEQIWLDLCTCLLLACKSTEQLRRPRDVINVCHYAQYGETMPVNLVQYCQNFHSILLTTSHVRISTAENN